MTRRNHGRWNGYAGVWKCHVPDITNGSSREKTEEEKEKEVIAQADPGVRQTIQPYAGIQADDRVHQPIEL